MTVRDFLLDYLKKNNLYVSLDRNDYVIMNGAVCLYDKLDSKLRRYN